MQTLCHFRSVPGESQAPFVVKPGGGTRSKLDAGGGAQERDQASANDFEASGWPGHARHDGY